MNQIITIIKRKITELAKNRSQQQVLEDALLKDNEILDEIETTKKIIDKLSREAEGLRKQNHAYSERYEEKERDIRRLDDQLIESHNKNANLKTKIEILEDENRELKSEKNATSEGVTSPRKPKKNLVNKEFEEAKEEIENLEEDKKILRQKIKELSDENKALKEEKNELEAGLDNYFKPSPEESIKTIVSENAARVAQEKEQERIREKLVEAQRLLEEKEDEIVVCNEIIEDYDRRIIELCEENILLQEELDNYKNPSPKKNAPPPLSRVPSRLDNSLPEWQKEMSREDLVEEILYWCDEIKELKTEIKKLTKKDDTQKEEKASENPNSEQKPKSRPSSRASLNRRSSSSSSGRHSRTHSNTSSPRHSLIMTSMDNTGEVGVQAISRKPSRNNSSSSLHMVETPADYTDNQETRGDYFTHNRRNNSSTDSTSTDGGVSKIAHDLKIKSFNGIIRDLRERVNILETSLNVAEINYNNKTNELIKKTRELEESKAEKKHLLNDSTRIISNLRADKEELQRGINNLIELNNNERVADLEEKLTKTQDFLRQSLTDRANDIQNLEKKKNEIQSIPNSKQDKLKKQAQATGIEIENAKREKNRAKVISGLKKMEMIKSTLFFINESSRKVVDELDNLLVDCQGNWEEKWLAIEIATGLSIEKAPWSKEGENIEEKEELTAEDDELMTEYKDLVDMIKEGEKAWNEKDKATEKIREKNNELVAQESVIKDAKKSIEETEKLLDLTDFKKEQKIKDGLAEQLSSLQQLIEASQARIKEGKEELKNLAEEMGHFFELLNKYKAILNDPTIKLTDRERKMIEETNNHRQRSIEKRAARGQHITLRNDEEAEEQRFIKEQMENLAALQEEIQQLITEKSAAKEALAKVNLGEKLEQILQQKEELAEKLASLNTKLADLTEKILSPEELAAQEREIEEQTKECQKTQNDYEKQLDELNKLTGDNNNNNNNNNNNFVERWQKIQETKEKIQNSTKDLERKKEEKVADNLKRITGEYKKVLLENKQLNEQLASQSASDQENNDLSDELAKIQAEKQTAEKKVVQLTTEKSELETKVNKLKTDKETVEDELANAEYNLEEKNGVIAENANKIDELQKDKETLNQGILQVNEENTKLAAKLRTAEEDIATLQVKIGEIEKKECAECENKKSKIAELENRNGELILRPTHGYLKAIIKEWKGKNDELKSSLEAAESKYQFERTRANNLVWGKNELEELLKRSKKEIDNLKNQLNNSAIAIHNVVEDRKIVIFEKAGLTSEINSLKAQIENINKKKIRRDWKNINQNLTPELKKQWKQKGFSREETKDWIGIGLEPKDYEFAAWLRDIKRVDSDWVLNHGNNEELQAEYSVYLDEKGFLTVNSLNKLRENLAEKEGELTSAKENYEALQREHRKAKSDLVDSEGARKSNEETINGLRTKIEEKEKVLIDQVEKQGAEVELLKTLTSERDEWRGKYKDATNSAQIKQREDQNIQEKLSEENAKLSTQVTAQQTENDELNKKKEELEAKLLLIGNASQVLLEEHEKIKENLEKSQATNEFLTEQSRQKQTEIDSLKMEMEELEKLAADIQRAWQEKLDQKAEDLEVAETLLSSEKNSFTAQRDKVKELREKFLASQAEQKKLQVEKKEKEQAIVKLQEEIAKLTKKGKSDSAKAKQKIAELEDKKDNLLQEKKNWKKEQNANTLAFNSQKTQQELIEKELKETKEKLTKKLAQQSKQFKERQDNLQNKLEEANNKLINSISKVDELNKKLNEVKEVAENSLTDYQNTITSKNKDLSISQTELENLKKRYQKELNSAQENQTWLEDQLERLREEMINELAAHGETKQNFQRQIAQLEQERDTRPNTNRVQYAILKNLKETDNKNKTNADEINLQKAQINTLEKNIKKLNKQKEQADEMIKDLKIAGKKDEKIIKKSLSFGKKNANLKNLLNNAQINIKNVRSYLKVKNLKNLPTLPQNADGTNKSLKQLVNDFSQIQNQLQAEKQRADNYENDICQEFNITNVNDWKNELVKLKSRPSHNDYDNIKSERDLHQQERDNYKQELDTHQCRINCQEPCCLGDYERLQKKLTTQKKEIFWEINNSLELGLEENPTLSQVITRLQELLRRPNSPSKVSETPFGEDLVVIREIDLVMLRNILSPLTKSEIQSIEQAVNYRELANARQGILTNYLKKGQEQLRISKQENKQLVGYQYEERIIWLILLVISWIAIFGLALQLKKSKRIRKE